MDVSVVGGNVAATRVPHEEGDHGHQQGYAKHERLAEVPARGAQLAKALPHALSRLERGLGNLEIHVAVALSLAVLRLVRLTRMRCRHLTRTARSGASSPSPISAWSSPRNAAICSNATALLGVRLSR